MTKYRSTSATSIFVIVPSDLIFWGLPRTNRIRKNSPSNKVSLSSGFRRFATPAGNYAVSSERSGQTKEERTGRERGERESDTQIVSSSSCVPKLLKPVAAWNSGGSSPALRGLNNSGSTLGGVQLPDFSGRPIRREHRGSYGHRVDVKCSSKITTGNVRRLNQDTTVISRRKYKEKSPNVTA